MFLNSIRKVAAAVALVVGAGTANAIVISDSGTYNFSWSYDTGSFTISGDGTVSISGFNSSSLTALFTLNNYDSAGVNVRLTAFGFGIDPNATSVTFLDSVDGGMVDASLAAIPSIKTVEVCAFGGQNCAGGGNGGILEGGSDTFSLILAGNWGASVTLDPIAFKYQTTPNSYEFTTSTSSTSSTSGGTSSSGNIPEPGTLSLLGGALLGGLFQYRRRRNAKV